MRELCLACLLISTIGCGRSSAPALPTISAKQELKSELLKNGKRMEWMEVNGQRDGVERVFFPDGKLHREIEYKAGKRNGHGRAFWEDGSLQFVAEYVNDVEISGESWDPGVKSKE